MESYYEKILHASFFISSDLIIAACHFIIPAIFVKLAWRRKDIDLNWVSWFFILTILSRGFIHLLTAWNAFQGNFKVLIITKLVYLISSVGMVFLLWKIFPILVTIPSVQHLEDVNAKLETSVADLLAEKEERQKVQNTLLQSQKMEAVGQLTGGIAHDFNNLLMAIGGNLELIKRNPLSKKVDRWIGNSIESVARAAHLTGQLLTFSRDQKLDLKEVSLRSCMDNSRDMIVRTIGMTVTLVMENIADVIVFVDPIQLELALLNLSLNARDAIGNKGIITFSTQVMGNTIEIDITDTGHGVPDTIADRIFDPFFTTKDIGKGTGLGLSMVHSVMSQFDGDVYIKQTSSRGTTITLTLPCKTKDDNRVMKDDGVIDESSAIKHVLVVDDEHLVREILEDMVQDAGYKVDSCEDGADALVFLKAHRPDIVLCDFAMPIMTGEEVMKATRLLYPDLPFVFVTGYAKSDAMKDHLVLKKPFNASDIKALLDKVLSS